MSCHSLEYFLAHVFSYGDSLPATLPMNLHLAWKPWNKCSLFCVLTLGAGRKWGAQRTDLGRALAPPCCPEITSAPLALPGSAPDLELLQGWATPSVACEAPGATGM